MQQITSYSIQKSYVRFQCPICSEWLNTNLADAGKQDTCPCCANAFISPASKELAELIAKQRVKVDEIEADRRKANELQEAKRQRSLELKAAQQKEAKERQEAKNASKPHFEPTEDIQPTIVVNRSTRKWWTRKKVFFVLLIAVAGYFSFGVFVIQPIGAVPTGATVIYIRLGLNLPFISSADGLLIKSGNDVSLLGRAVAMAAIAKTIGDRKIVGLPYSRTLYLWSTGGREFDR